MLDLLVLLLWYRVVILMASGDVSVESGSSSLFGSGSVKLASGDSAEGAAGSLNMHAGFGLSMHGANVAIQSGDSFLDEIIGGEMLVSGGNGATGGDIHIQSGWFIW